MHSGDGIGVTTYPCSFNLQDEYNRGVLSDSFKHEEGSCFLWSSSRITPKNGTKFKLRLITYEELTLERFILRAISDQLPTVLKFYEKKYLRVSNKAAPGRHQLLKENLDEVKGLQNIYDLLARLVSDCQTTQKQLYFYKFARIFFKVFEEAEKSDKDNQLAEVNAEDFFKHIIKEMINSGGLGQIEDLESDFFSFGIFVDQVFRYGIPKDTRVIRVCDYFLKTSPKPNLQNSADLQKVKKLLETSYGFMHFAPRNYLYLLELICLNDDPKHNIAPQIKFLRKHFNRLVNKGLGEVLVPCLKIDTHLIRERVEAFNGASELLDCLGYSRECLKQAESTSTEEPNPEQLVDTERREAAERELIEACLEKSSEKFPEEEVWATLVLSGCLAGSTVSGLLIEMDSEGLKRLITTLFYFKDQNLKIGKTFLREILERLQSNKLTEKVPELLGVAPEGQESLEIFFIFFATENQLPDISLGPRASLRSMLKQAVESILEVSLNPEKIEKKFLDRILGGDSEARKQKLAQLYRVAKQDEPLEGQITLEAQCAILAENRYIQFSEARSDFDKLLGAFELLACCIFAEKPDSQNFENLEKFEFFEKRMKVEIPPEKRAELEEVIARGKDGLLTLQELADFQTKFAPKFKVGQLRYILRVLASGELGGRLLLTLLATPDLSFFDFSEKISLYILNALNIVSGQNEAPLEPKSVPLDEFSANLSSLTQKLEFLRDHLSEPLKLWKEDYEMLKRLGVPSRGYSDLQGPLLLKKLGLNEDQLEKTFLGLSFFKIVENLDPILKTTELIETINQIDNEDRPKINLSASDRQFNLLLQETKKSLEKAGGEAPTFHDFYVIISNHQLGHYIKVFSMRLWPPTARKSSGLSTDTSQFRCWVAPNRSKRSKAKFRT